MSTAQHEAIHAQLLIVEDEVDHAEVMAEALRRLGHVCTIVDGVASAEEELRLGSFDVIVTDLSMEKPDSGLEVLRYAREHQPDSEIIMVTAHGDVGTAKAALQGADLDAMLASGGTVGIYHTAGKGTRLAPLPGAENNNKPGVKLPSLVEVSPGVTSELTILEAVVRQTGCYAPHRAGRCSVFWGDQIFVPAAGHLPSGFHHADILAQMGPMPSEEEWTLKGLDKYGLITVNDQNEAAQVEKVSYETAQHLLKTFGKVTSVGPSLGSFSLSNEMLMALLAEFAADLASKQAKMDSDPHFWMPLTLAKDAYVSVMVTKVSLF